MYARQLSALAVLVAIVMTLDVHGAQRTAPARKAAPATTRVEAEMQCPSDLGTGIRTKRRFCDVLTGNDPKDGVLVTIPPHRGPVTLSFELHNRHMYSEELIKANRAFRQYTATIGVLAMDNTLIDRAVIRSEFRTAADLFDRVGGGAGPGGVKAVAPSGAELITMELPGDIGEQVSILGEHLSVKRPEGEDNFVAPGRPIATISQVMLDYRPAPAKRAPVKKAPPKKP
ncbi:MAG TPA: hypothetical protein VMO26_20700 [Vicinamibacterales bacterium]|nr:hypothetical protein [Vicinamibacterales bacterium]